MVSSRFTGAGLSFFFSLLLLGLSGGSFAQTGPSEKQEATAENLTFTLLDIQDQYKNAPLAQKAGHLEKMLATAAARQNHLATLIQTNPAQVLRLRLPKHHRASLPVPVQALVEDETTLDGDMEVFHEDREDGSVYRYFLRTGQERLSLHFAGEAPTLKTGHRVRIKGVRVKQALALGTGTTGVQTLAAAVPNSLGAKNTLVLLVNFQDNATQPYTADFARNVVFTTTSNWDLENSYQQTSLTGDVQGWFTLPMSSTVCDTNTLATLAKNAATAAGINLSSYVRYVYAFPKNGCAWWGLGMVGGTPSQAWINGSFQLAVVAHEMGHNFGLWHSHALECGATTIGTTCSTIEYGDPIDIMGSSSGHLNAFQKERLGWLNAGASPPITTVLGSGTYLLDSYEMPGNNAKALKILQSTDSIGRKTWYYVEYRRATGFDSFLSSNSNVLNGVVVHRGSETSGDSSFLLDMTPATTSWTDPALIVGQTFTDTAAGVTISVAWVSATGAAVNVTMGSSPPCVRANPTVSVTPSESQWVPAGTPATYTLSLINNDNAGCSAGTFDLQATAPSGWSATFVTTPLTAAPGATASATATMTSPASLGDGFYSIGLSATNRAASTFIASSSVTYVVKNVAVMAPAITSQPQSGTVTAPATATFTVSASGTAPLSYQWQKNGATIAGATSASYTTPATSTVDSGSSYRVVVSNSVSSVTSSTATMTVNSAFNFSITSEPSKTVAPGSSVTNQITLSVISGTGQAVSFSTSGLPAGATASVIPGSCTATCSATLSIQTQSTTPSGSSTITVTGTSGTFSRSSTFTLAVANSTSIQVGDTVQLLISAPFYTELSWGNYAGYLGYQPAGARGLVLAGPTVDANATWVRVDLNLTTSHVIGWVQISQVTKVVSTAVAPTIAGAPSNVTVTAPASASFSVTATGTAPLSYQWQKNGLNISGATASSYTTPATTIVDSGNTFRAVVSNSAGSVTSSAATLTVNPAPGAIPTITTQPVSQTVTAPATATFSVSTSGTAPLSYQWQKNGVNISGATASSYTMPATTIADSGSSYRVVVSNMMGSVTSNAAMLTVNADVIAPSITSQPVNLTVTAPAMGTFSVSASGTAPLSYQWQKNGATIAGATSASYTTPATTTADSGSSYRVVVSNMMGSVTSNAATMTVSGGTSTPTVTLSYSGKIRDKVGQNNMAASADGAADGIFTLTLAGGGPRTLTGLTLRNSGGGTWDTQAASVYWTLGVASGLDSALLNPADNVSTALTTGGSVTLFAADWNNNMFNSGVSFTVIATFADGTTATAATTVGGGVTQPIVALSYNGMLRDKVGQNNRATSADGALDGAFTLTLTSGGPRTLTGLTLRNSGGGTWDTQATSVYWTLGVASGLDSALLNPADNVSTALATGGSVTLFAADWNNNMFVAGTSFTLTATFADGTTATSTTQVAAQRNP